MRNFLNEIASAAIVAALLLFVLWSFFVAQQCSKCLGLNRSGHFFACNLCRSIPVVFTLSALSSHRATASGRYQSYSRCLRQGIIPWPTQKHGGFAMRSGRYQSYTRCLRHPFHNNANQKAWRVRHPIGLATECTSLYFAILAQYVYVGASRNYLLRETTLHAVQ